MGNRSHALVAGFFVILFGCATVFALWWLGHTGEDTNRYVLETRRNVPGLNNQATVRFRGIRAGKVESISTDPADPQVLQVFITVDRRFILTQGTTARLGYQGVTGLAFVSLEDDGSAPEPLKVGAGGTAPRIALQQSLLETLGDKGEDIVARFTLAAGRVASAADRMAAVLDEKNARNLARTLDNAATISEGLKTLPETTRALRAVVSSANLQRVERILAHVESTAGQATPLAREVRELLRSMNALSQKIERVAAQGAAVGEELGGETLPRADALLRELQQSARQMSQLMEMLEAHPQAVIFGSPPSPSGPGESGFQAPKGVQGLEK